MALRILGIDPGFDRLGVCVLEKDGNKETLVYSECIQTSKKDLFGARLALLGDAVEKLLEKYKPQELAMEKIFFTKNQTTAIQVAEVRGVILYLSELHKLSHYEYSPPEIKLAIAGHGKATKEDIHHMILKILPNQIEGKRIDDEMDAIAIALTHSAHRRMKMLI